MVTYGGLILSPFRHNKWSRGLKPSVWTGGTHTGRSWSSRAVRRITSSCARIPRTHSRSAFSRKGVHRPWTWPSSAGYTPSSQGLLRWQLKSHDAGTARPLHSHVQRWTNNSREVGGHQFFRALRSQPSSPCKASNPKNNPFFITLPSNPYGLIISNLGLCFRGPSNSFPNSRAIS